MSRLALAVVLLLAGVTALASRASRDHRPQNAGDPLIGAWRLVALEDEAPDGSWHGRDATGLFLFTRDGHASVQVMIRDPEPAVPGAVQYSQGGYEASFGRYSVDEASRTFTFKVEGALVRTLVGKDLVRAYVLSGGRLVVRPASPGEHWRVTWERY